MLLLQPATASAEQAPIDGNEILFGGGSAALGGSGLPGLNPLLLLFGLFIARRIGRPPCEQ